MMSVQWGRNWMEAIAEGFAISLMAAIFYCVGMTDCDQ